MDVDATELASHLRLTVVRLYRLLRQQDESSLTPTLGSALATVFRWGPLTLGELATRERIAPPSITNTVGKLETLGLVVRLTDAKDKRICRVEATDAGRQQIESNRTRRTAWLATRLEELDPEDLARLVAAADVLEQLTVAPPELDTEAP
ncbi:MAG: regulatory protein MarR [Actinomycetia bacterium]|nr:regulatory protein MarR [Actinomycetes bacterium]